MDNAWWSLGNKNAVAYFGGNKYLLREGSNVSCLRYLHLSEAKDALRHGLEDAVALSFMALSAIE